MDNRMLVRKPQADAKFAHTVFAEYPLLGSKILSEKQLEQLHSNTAGYISQVTREPKRIKAMSSEAKMQVTLSVINHAKNWDNDINSLFWSYIMLQYGVRKSDDSTNDKRYAFLTTCIEDSLKLQNRWFVQGKNAREFKATVVAHALSPKKSWYSLISLLYDFYHDNLRGEYFENDPLITTMTQLLRSRFTDDQTSENDQDMSLSDNKVYRFQEGVWKLIKFQPEYAEIVFKRILACMDKMENGESPKIKYYEEALCKEWYEERCKRVINGIIRQNGVRRSTRTHELAFGYSQIRLKYYLEENDFGVIIPDIRISKEKVDRVYLRILVNDEKMKDVDFDVFGNELGRTVLGRSISLLPFVDRLGKEFDIRLQIICDDDIEYDSKDYLRRRALLFDTSMREVPFGSCQRGDYVLVRPKNVRCILTNIDATVDKEWGAVEKCDIHVNKGFNIFVGSKLLTADIAEDKSLRLIVPDTVKDISYEIDGDSFPVVTTGESLTLIVSNKEKIEQYQLFINDTPIDWEGVTNSTDSVGLVYHVVCKKKEGSAEPLLSIKLVEKATEKCIFDKTYLVVKNTSVKFSKSVYAFDSEINAGKAIFDLNGQKYELTMNSGEDKVRLPYEEGDLTANVPKLDIEWEGLPLYGPGQIWFDSVSEDCRIKVSSNCEAEVGITIGETTLEKEGNDHFKVGGYVHETINTTEKSDVVLHYRTKGKKGKKTIATIYWEDTFKENVEVKSADDKIIWNLGGGYIGEDDECFYILLKQEHGRTFIYDLNLGSEIVSTFGPEMEGRYSFEIYKKADTTDKLLSKGKCIIGDIDKIRFKGERIRISELTNDDGDSLHINTVFIDDIVPEEPIIQNTTEGRCPVYRGTMYVWSPSRKKKIPFADTDIAENDPRKEIVNPVRIVYINETVLCITDQDHDGLYYRAKNSNSLYNTTYEMTDEIPPKGKGKNTYRVADLYRYTLAEK